MNWVFEAYSNVYNVAMMRGMDHPINFAPMSQSENPNSNFGRRSQRR